MRGRRRSRPANSSKPSPIARRLAAGDARRSPSMKLNRLMNQSHSSAVARQSSHGGSHPWNTAPGGQSQRLAATTAAHCATRRSAAGSPAQIVATTTARPAPASPAAIGQARRRDPAERQSASPGEHDRRDHRDARRRAASAPMQTSARSGGRAPPRVRSSGISARVPNARDKARAHRDRARARPTAIGQAGGAAALPARAGSPSAPWRRSGRSCRSARSAGSSAPRPSRDRCSRRGSSRRRRRAAASRAARQPQQTPRCRPRPATPATAGCR